MDYPPNWRGGLDVAAKNTTDNTDGADGTEARGIVLFAKPIHEEKDNEFP
jgi:hypothetical protein